MFGHQDEPAQQTNTTNDQPAPVQPDAAYNPALPPADMSYGVPQPAAPVDPAPVTDTNLLLEQQAPDGYTTQPDPAAQPFPQDQTAQPAQDQIQDQSTYDSTPAPQTVGAPTPLTDLKQQALQQLSPLVGHLDQTPEEKFRTTMMMIQASDNQDLLQTAYDAANQIEDEKVRAQALLDVINEINYFSQKQN